MFGAIHQHFKQYLITNFPLTLVVKEHNHDCACLEIPTKFILKQQHAEMYKVSHLAKYMVVFTPCMFLRSLTTIK